MRTEWPETARPVVLLVLAESGVPANESRPWCGRSMRCRLSQPWRDVGPRLRFLAMVGDGFVTVLTDSLL